MTLEDLKAKMIARRASKGFNAEQAAQVLDDLIASHSGENLVHALTYREFATERAARAFAAQV